jgi:hypothetical protein
MKGSKVLEVVAEITDKIGVVGSATFITLTSLAIGKNEKLPALVKVLGYTCVWLIGLFANDAYDELTHKLWEAESATKILEIKEEESNKKN